MLYLETTINYIDETPKLTDKFVKEKLSGQVWLYNRKRDEKTIRDEISRRTKQIISES